MRHHHGYMWLGSGLAQTKDGIRRAGHPDFPSTGVPPLELAHWLLKPGRAVRGTWTDAKEAAGWWGEQARPLSNKFADPHDRDVLEKRIAAAVPNIDGGEDVAGGWWLTDSRYLGVYLIACSPHRFRPDYACPAPSPALLG